MMCCCVREQLVKHVAPCNFRKRFYLGTNCYKNEHTHLPCSKKDREVHWCDTAVTAGQLVKYKMSAFNEHAPYMKGYNITFPLSVELTFDGQVEREWYKKNWSVSIWISLVYVMCVYVGRRCMMSRKKFHLRQWLCMWNSSLAVMSIICFSRMMAEMMYIWRHKGFTATMCVSETLYMAPNALWVFFFNLSKVVELGDTMFIVLRKQQLHFLHWYHHVTALVYVWYSSTSPISVGRWFMTMNIAIHSLMYTYYALKSIRVHVPRCVSIALTTLQISQMGVGLAVNVLAYRLRSTGEACEQTTDNMVASLLLYTSYLILFIHYFCKAYLFSPNSKKLVNANVQHVTKYKTDCVKID